MYNACVYNIYIYINYNMYTSTFRGVVLCMFSGNFSRGMLIVAFNRERWLEASWTKTSWFLDFHMFDFFPSIFDPSLIHVPFPRPVAQLRSHKLEPIILQPRTPRPLSAGRGNSKGGGAAIMGCFYTQLIGEKTWKNMIISMYQTVAVYYIK